MDIRNFEITPKEKDALKKTLENSAVIEPKYKVRLVYSWFELILGIACLISLFFVENRAIKALIIGYIVFKHISYFIFLKLDIMARQRFIFVINTLLKRKNIDIFS